MVQIPLDLNWSKTYFMFVTNKRINLPNEIAVCKDINGKDIQVSVVNNFKLLGVTINNKLNFSDDV